MPETVDIRIPSLDQRRKADDLETALVGISGIWHVNSDTTRHVITVEYDPEHATPQYIEQIIRKSGYPIEDGREA